MTIGEESVVMSIGFCFLLRETQHTYPLPERSEATGVARFASVPAGSCRNLRSLFEIIPEKDGEIKRSLSIWMGWPIAALPTNQGG